MDSETVVKKLWNLCNTLRDNGISYEDYITELTYILFLKMMEEQGNDDRFPDGYCWHDLIHYTDNVEMFTFYKKMLEVLSDKKTDADPLVSQIYENASTHIQNPVDLAQIVHTINDVDWYSAKEENLLGDMYEGLLEKTANETKSGAGQYFTPRALINVIVDLIAPQIEERCNDPACGTFGFMIKASQYLKHKTDDFFEINEKQRNFEENEAFSGMELVPKTHRLALMNALLHDMHGKIAEGDSLSSSGQWMKNFDVVMTNPPFGTKAGSQRQLRDDIIYPTSNKQLDFLQIIYNSLNQSGHARAGVVVPDNVLFAGGVGEKVRKDLLDKCNLHTILRLPSGIFYAKGVQTNVLFFERGTEDFDNTKEVWVYDMRTNFRTISKAQPLKESDFSDFVKLYNSQDISQRSETYSAENPDGRWRKYTIDQIKNRLDTNLDFSWIKVKDDSEDQRSVSEIINDMANQVTKINDSIDQLKKILGNRNENDI